MHRELLDALSVITEEEQRILDEQRGIDPQLYTEKKELIVDRRKIVEKGKLIQVRPHTRFVNFPKHKHNYVEVIYMCQGTTTHILNGSKVILEAGGSSVFESECRTGDPAGRRAGYCRQFYCAAGIF